MAKSTKQWTIEQQEVENLTKRHDHLLSEVAELAQGIGATPSWYNRVTDGWDVCMKFKAARALKAVAGMPL